MRQRRLHLQRPGHLHGIRARRRGRLSRAGREECRRHRRLHLRRAAQALVRGHGRGECRSQGFTERFYAKRCAGSLEPVLDTLKYLVHETDVWTEITTLLIPGENDFDEELDALTQWVARELRADVPLHFTAFHPDYRMLETEPTPPPTLQKARAIAIRNGLHHVYVGNVHDPARQATLCPTCGARAIARDGYTIKSLRARRLGRVRKLRDQDGGRVRRRSPARGARGGCPSTSNATRRDTTMEPGPLLVEPSPTSRRTPEGFNRSKAAYARKVSTLRRRLRNPGHQWAVIYGAIPGERASPACSGLRPFDRFSR